MIPEKRFAKNATTARALLHYGIAYDDGDDAKRLQDKMKCYQYIVKHYPKTVEADKAFFFQAQRYFFS